jgi:ABC-type Fe3+-hydroxamate transport system substrate-binding protein
VSRRAFLLGLALLYASGCQKSETKRQAPRELRIASLAPCIDETLRALGASDLLVGVSDYSENLEHLPRLGSSITPAAEAIARTKPSHILATVTNHRIGPDVASLGELVVLPWLTPQEIAGSIRSIGRLVYREPQAEALAGKFAALPTSPPAGAPRVLVLLASEASVGVFWYVRRDSLHGALLHAAGAKNAVDPPRPGAPRLTVEELLQLDPDAIIALTNSDSPHAAEATLGRVRSLAPLRAVRSGRLHAVAWPQAESVGPGSLRLTQGFQNALSQVAP